MKALIDKFLAIRDKRKQVEDLLKRIEAAEKDLEAQIIASFDGSGTQSLKTSSGKTVSRSSRTSYIVGDAGSFVSTQARLYAEAAAGAQDPDMLSQRLREATIYQLRPAAQRCKMLVEDLGVLSWDEAGIKEDTRATLSIRSS